MSRARFFEVAADQSGRPISGVSVAVYDTGTTTPIAGTIYAAAVGGGTLSNPLTANDQGELEFFLAAPSKVDLVWSRNGFTSETFTVDVLDAAQSGATDLSYYEGDGVKITVGEALAAEPGLIYVQATDSTHYGWFSIQANTGEFDIGGNLVVITGAGADPIIQVANEGVGFNGAAPSVPVIPASPTAADIAAVLVALGLATQAP